MTVAENFIEVPDFVPATSKPTPPKSVVSSQAGVSSFITVAGNRINKV